MTSTISRRSFALGSLGVAGCAAGALSAESDVTRLYSQSDAIDLARHVQRGEVTALELLEEAIRRTLLVNDKLNAVTVSHFDWARETLTRPLPTGPFQGVPFLLKDLGTQLAGTETTGGSRLLKGIVARRDDELVRRYKQAGFVIFGKTNTPEFGMALTTESYLHGPCRNPWNLEHSTAGSSGGSAAAVAAGIVPVAHATDGGGSIRVPASACGVFGFKPTRALTPRSVGPSMMSVSHVVSRTVRDSAALLDATAGYSAGLPFVSPEPVGGYLAATRHKLPASMKIALVTQEPALKVHPDVQAAIEKTAEALIAMGHTVEEAAPGVDFEKLNAAQNTLILAEFSEGITGLGKALERPLDSTTLERLSLEFVDVGARTPAADYLAAWNHVQSVTYKLANFFERFDVMLSPVTVTPAPKLGVINEQDDDDYLSFVNRFRTYSAYTPLQNLTGVPAVSLPVGLSREGLPVAAMLSAALGKDALLMSLSAALEEALPFLSQRPPVSAA